MPFKLINKLILILSSILLFFIISFSLCFGFIFLHHSKNVENSRLETKALTLSDVLSKTTDDNLPIATNYNNNILQLINNINQGEIWIVDKNNLQITGSKTYPTLTYAQLSNEATQDIQKIFTGQNIRTYNFATFTNPEYFTIGVPIYDKQGQVKAGLLLHDKLPTINYSWYDGLGIILLCSLILFVISILLLIYFTKKYILTICVINDFIAKILNHQYNLQIKTKSNDELSLLAENINKLAKYLQNIKELTKKKNQSNYNLIIKTAYKLHTPLKELKNSIDEFSSQNINSLNKATVKNINKDIEKLQHTINNLLNFSQLDNNDFSLKKDLLNLVEILTDSIKSRQKFAKDKNIILNTQITLKQKIILFSGDEHRLKQMFCETLDKAIQLYPQNSIIIINVLEDDTHYFIQIKNNNSEISINQLPDIFQQFYTKDFDDNLFNSIELTIAQHLASLHKIKLSYQKQTDEYITFIFKLNK